MSRRVCVAKYKVPYLREKVIEEHAQLLLDEWSQEHPAVTEPPVPIDEILEVGLGLEFKICDLQSEFGHPDILGGIWFGARLVKVDLSLDPKNNPGLLGRYRFTLAHEVGHWRLHRHHLMDDPATASLFEDKDTPAFVCRSSIKPPEEWQADQFAACVLMPRRLVFQAWERWRGQIDPASLVELGIDERD